MIKTIFCDLGNVLVKVDYPLALRVMSEFFGLPEEALTRPAVMELERAFESGQLTPQQYLTRIKQLLPAHNHFTLDDLIKLWQIPFEYNWEVWELMQAVRRQVPVVLLSNTNPLHIQSIRQKFDLFEYLDGWVLSYEVGALKPAPAIYQAALRKAQIEPTQTLLIDDLAENVAGARDQQIQAYQFVSYPALHSFLQNNSLLT